MPQHGRGRLAGCCEWAPHHLDDMGETYCEHMNKALSFGAETCMSTCLFVVHAVVPWCFTDSVTSRVIDLGRRLEARTAGRQPPQQPLQETESSAAHGKQH
jgi:hypothetical protein